MLRHVLTCCLVADRYQTLLTANLVMMKVGCSRAHSALLGV